MTLAPDVEAHSLLDCKIFCLGLPKTGTTSLDLAFKNAGLNVQGFNKRGLNAFLEHGVTDFHWDLLAKGDTFSDWPWCLMWRHVLERADTPIKFVLTERSSPETWLRSMKRHAMTTNTSDLRRSVYQIGMPHGFEEQLLSMYRRHRDTVLETFEKAGRSDDLLQITTGEGNEIGKIGAFVGFDFAESDLPHANRSEGRSTRAVVQVRNLKIVNRNRQGQGRGFLTVDEANLKRSDEVQRPAVFDSAIRLHTSVWERLLTASEKERDDLVRDYVANALDVIEANKLFRVDQPCRDGFTTGYKHLPRKELLRQLTRTALKLFRKSRYLPNLIVPHRFSEQLLVFKFFGEMSLYGTENKLHDEVFVSARAEALLTPFERPFRSTEAVVPDNADVPPGTYFFKANHGWGLYRKVDFPCDDAERARLEKVAAKWINNPSSGGDGQWWKPFTKPEIFLEASLGDNQVVFDWKFFVFRGKVGLVQVDKDRHGDHKQSVFDRDFNFIDQRMYFSKGEAYPKPKNYDAMVEVAEEIGRQFEFMRIDLYNVDGKIYLGELSALPNGGAAPVSSLDLDLRLGAFWDQQGFISQRLETV